MNFSFSELVEDCQMAPGRVLVVPFNVEIKAPGSNIILPSTNREAKGSADSLYYGQVLLCGYYCAGRNPLYDVPGFPLPGGTLVEYSRPYPFLPKAEPFVVINTEDIIRWWPGNHPPPWWPKDSQ